MKMTSQKQERNRDEQNALHDPVWDLLRQSPATNVSAGFADRVAVAAREADAMVAPFWSRARAMMTAVAAAAAALVVAVTWVALPEPMPVVVHPLPDSSDAFAPLDEVASQEMLLAATDHLGEFSDTELVDLIGF